MIFHVPRLIMEISKIFTLEAGDLILTGTPEGVGPIKATFFSCGVGIIVIF